MTTVAEAMARWTMNYRGPTALVVAVDGPSASGKSTLARSLALQVGAALLQGDDFYRVMSEDQRLRLSPQEGVDRYFDWERMREEALAPLRRGRAVTFRPYDWESGSLRTQVKHVGSRPIVLVEGVYASRRELSDLVDHTILVETDASVRAARQRVRADASWEWVRRWDAAETWFFQRVRPQSEFDLVVSGLPTRP